MKAAVEIINPYDKKKLTALFNMKFFKVKLMGADLGIGQNVGLGFYKVVTFFFTKYRNQHQFIILEGEDPDENKVYLLTELCSTNSGSGSSNGRSGYFLYYSREEAQLFAATNQKNPVCNITYHINVSGEDVYEGVTREKEKYKIIGNNCQDYAERFIKFILGRSEEKMKNDSVDDLHISDIVPKKKKKIKGKKSMKADSDSSSEGGKSDNDSDSLIESSESKSDSMSSSIQKQQKAKKKPVNISKASINKKEITITMGKKMINTANNFKVNTDRVLGFRKDNQWTTSNVTVINNARPINRPKLSELKKNDEKTVPNSDKKDHYSSINASKPDTTNFKMIQNARPRVHTADTGNNLRNENIEKELRDNGLIKKQNLQEILLRKETLTSKNKLLVPKHEMLKKLDTLRSSLEGKNKEEAKDVQIQFIPTQVPSQEHNNNSTKPIIINNERKPSDELPQIKINLRPGETKETIHKKEYSKLSFNKRFEANEYGSNQAFPKSSKMSVNIRDKKLFPVRYDQPVLINNSNVTSTLVQEEIQFKKSIDMSTKQIVNETEDETQLRKHPSETMISQSKTNLLIETNNFTSEKPNIFAPKVEDKEKEIENENKTKISSSPKLKAVKAFELLEKLRKDSSHV